MFHSTSNISSFTDWSYQLLMFFSPICFWFRFWLKFRIFQNKLRLFLILTRSSWGRNSPIYIYMYRRMSLIYYINDLFTCAVLLVALYGTSESLARCFPASNTFRCFVVTFRQIVWCFFYTIQNRDLHQRPASDFFLLLSIIIENEIGVKEEIWSSCLHRIFTGKKSLFLLISYYSFCH